MAISIEFDAVHQTTHFQGVVDGARAEENYLNKHIQLAPEGVHKAITLAIQNKDEKPAFSYETKNVLWNIAAWTTIVASAIIAVGSIVAVGYFFPVYLPFVPLVTYILLDTIIKPTYEACFDYAKDNWERHEYRTAYEEVWRNELEELSSEGVAQKIRELAAGQPPEEIDANLDNIVQQHDLRPLLAEYICGKNKEDSILEEIRSKQEKIAEVKEKLNEEGISQELYDRKLVSLRRHLIELWELREKYACTKVFRAFQHSVLCQPTQDTNFSQVGFSKTTSPLDAINREAFQWIQDERADELYRIFGRRIEAFSFPEREDGLTIAEVEHLTIVELARHVTMAASKNLNA